MSALALLGHLHTLGVEMTPYPDGTVDYIADAGILTPGLLGEIRLHKVDLYDLVEEWSERAAIAEYCGGLSRDVAEALAWTSLPPALIPTPPAAASADLALSA
jgi:hypothetical protein